MKKKPIQILYTCPICHSHYATVQKAEACRDQKADWSGWKVGDVCLIPSEAAYPWWVQENKPERHWIAFEEPAWPKSPSHFDHEPKTHFWYVIVGLIRDRRNAHLTRVVVYSPYRWGHNPCDGDGHCGLYRPGNPDGKTAVGKIFHMPEYARDPQCKFIMRNMRLAVPDVELLNSLPEVKDMIAKCQNPSFDIRLL